jgi:putative endonuclease
MFYVYVLKSLKDNKYYFGQTDNVSKRVNLHNSGKVDSTKTRIPFVLIGYKTFKSRSEARWLEYNIKNHSDKKRKFLKEINVIT